jgi:streptogramin lyase
VLSNALLLLTSACGISSVSHVGAAPARSQSLQGRVISGSIPVVNATVSIYAAGGPEGHGSALMAQGLTDAQGLFSAQVTCPQQWMTPGALVYATASGGGAGNGGESNTALALIVALGNCDELPGAFVVNELTTVATAFALSSFMSGDGMDVSSRGAANAMATAALLVEPTSGMIAATLPSTTACSESSAPNCEVRLKLGTLAGALAACSQSAGPQSAPCAALLSSATADTANSPLDTSQAALAIARNPGLVSVGGVFAVSTLSEAFGDKLAVAPNDWTLALTFSGGGLSEPTGLALDAMGNVWIANYDNAVTELSPSGAALSPAAGFTGGGIEESFGIAVDAAGDIWVCNEQSSGALNAGLGSLTKLAPDGTVSGAPIFAGGIDFPDAILADNAGDIWVANYGNSSLTELTRAGVPVSLTGFFGGGLSFPVALALDTSGKVWVANEGANQVSEFASGGTALSPSAGFGGGGLAVPQGIAIDQYKHVWIANYYANSVTEMTDQGAPLSGDAGYLGGGLNAPGGIAIDGAGTVWIANYRGASITALKGASSAAPGEALSPASGFSNAGLQQPFAIAIDPSGDVWVTNFGNDSVTEFIGIAAPVKTPLTGVPEPP